MITVMQELTKYRQFWISYFFNMTFIVYLLAFKNVFILVFLSSNTLTSPASRRVLLSSSSGDGMEYDRIHFHILQF